MDPFRRPEHSEYATYYGGYVRMVPDGPVVDFLKTRRDALAELLASVPADRETYRYAEGKWSVREVAGHVCDTERVFTYRTLQLARGAPDPLPGMDQEVFAAGSSFADRPLASIAREFTSVRDATISLVESLSPADMDRTGTASGNRFTVRALVWILAGHERHHAQVLAERYLTR